MSQQEEQGQDPAEDTVLGGHYRIHPDKPLPQLDSPMSHAVEVSDTRSPGRGMFGLVSRLDLLPRVDFIPQLSRLDRLAMITPVDAGAIHWPETGGRRFVIVFNRNFAERVCPDLNVALEPMHEDILVRTVITPLMATLKELADRHITHRAIRPDNIFYTDASRQSVVLGECVSAPPGISQPAAYEPLDSAMSRPSARGLGSIADDLYSFGATLAFLLTGGGAVAGKSDEEIVRAKAAQGSYSTLVGDARVSLTMMEPLRGFLCDDPKERWTNADLELWMSGRTLSPKQPMLPARASRALAVGDGEYATKLSLCNALGSNWSEAGQIITSGELGRWLQRALSDDDTTESLKEVMEAAAMLSDSEDRLTAKTLIILEPSLPLRYKDLCAKIDGLIDAFAIDFHDEQFRQNFVDMVDAKLPQVYLQSQPNSRPDQVVLMKNFDMINYFMDRPKIGSGLERALYETNRTWPCQSPLVQEQYVYEIQDLLPALEKVAKTDGATQEPVDRHIVAYCAARIRSFPERILRELENHDDLATFRLGILHLFAEVQRASGTKQKFPVLCKWIAGSVQPIVDSFHNLAYRKRLATEIEAASGKGDIMELLFLLDSYDARNQDTEGFDLAQREYAGHVRTIAWLESGGLTSAENIRFKSQQTATLISATISSLVIVALSLIYIV